MLLMPLFVRWQIKLSSAKPEIKPQTLLKSLGHRHSNCSMSSVLCWIGICGVKSYTELFTGMLKLAQTCPHCQTRHGTVLPLCHCSVQAHWGAWGQCFQSPWSTWAHVPSTLLTWGDSDISPVHDPEMPHSKPWDTRFPQKREVASPVNLLPPGGGSCL